jgi:lanosterol synthase
VIDERMADLTHWFLECDNGRQTWQYNEAAERVQSVMERYFLGLDTATHPQAAPSHSSAAQSPLQTAQRAIDFYQTLQHPDGHWPNDYGGPMFLLPGTPPLLSLSPPSPDLPLLS